MDFPADHWKGTPKLAQWAVERAILNTGVQQSKWQVPLEAIMFGESSYDPYAVSTVCAGCRGPMQLAVGMYENWFGVPQDAPALDPWYIDPVAAVELAIHYIKGDVPGYGGYANIGTLDSKGGLLARVDRGPGEMLRAWATDPKLSMRQLRTYYNGY